MSKKMNIAMVNEVRAQHGFAPRDGDTSRLIGAKNWSKRLLSESGGDLLPPQDMDNWPKNRPLYDALEQKFKTNNPNTSLRFDERVWTDMVPSKDEKKKGQMESIERRCVDMINLPTITGETVTLADMFLIPLEYFDDYERYIASGLAGEPTQPQYDIEKMNATGVGYKGFDGVSWVPALESFTLPMSFHHQLQDLAEGIFVLYDAVQTLWHAGDPQVVRMLTYKVPSHIPKHVPFQQVSLVRPDIVLVRDGGSFRPVLTELESCPAGEGMFYAMAHGYNDVEATIISRFAAMLKGRPFRVIFNREWPEYLWDQAVLVKVLAEEHDIDAQIIVTCPLQELHDEAQDWEAPVEEAQERWNTDLLGRLKKHGFDKYVVGTNDANVLYECPEGTVFKRFGYTETYSPEWLEAMYDIVDKGAPMLNPPWFSLDNKVILACKDLPAVREWIIENHGDDVMGVLDKGMAKTILLTSDSLTENPEITQDKDVWIVKFAGYDGNNKSWGARSVIFGQKIKDGEWSEHLQEYLQVGWPTIAQHTINSARFRAEHLDKAGATVIKDGLRTRFTPFFWRSSDGQVVISDPALTLRKDLKVHGASNALQVPVKFEK